MNEDKIVIDFLYLDLQSCGRCIGTDKILEETISALTPIMELAGYSIEYHKVEMSTATIAAEYRFLSSPTIRVNGQDICSTVTENNCGCCSDISGDDVDCRVFVYKGVFYDVPPKEMLVRGILEVVFSNQKPRSSHDYLFSNNLHKFFSGKAKKQACCGNGDCYDNNNSE